MNDNPSWGKRLKDVLYPSLKKEEDTRDNSYTPAFVCILNGLMLERHF